MKKGMGGQKTTFFHVCILYMWICGSVTCNHSMYLLTLKLYLPSQCMLTVMHELSIDPSKVGLFTIHTYAVKF